MERTTENINKQFENGEISETQRDDLIYSIEENEFQEEKTICENCQKSINWKVEIGDHCDNCQEELIKS